MLLSSPEDEAALAYVRAAVQSPPIMDTGRQLLLSIATGGLSRRQHEMSALERRATLLRPFQEILDSSSMDQPSPRQMGTELTESWSVLTHPAWRLRGAALEAAMSVRTSEMVLPSVTEYPLGEKGDRDGEEKPNVSNGLSDTCDIDVIDDVSMLTPEIFVRDYLIPSRPVMIRNAVNASSSWWRRFDPINFAAKEGHLKVKIGSIPYSRQFQLPELELSMMEFLQYMRYPTTSSVAVRFADELVKQNDMMRKMKRQEKQKRRRRRRGSSADTETEGGE